MTVSRTYRYLFLIAICVAWVGMIVPPPAVRANTAQLLIVEIMPGGIDNAGDEKVRVVNQTADTIDLSGWKLQYQSAAGTSWTTKAVFAGSIAPGQRVLAATAASAEGDIIATMTDGLSQTGGHVRLIDSAGLPQDVVGWGTAVHADGGAAPAPAKGQSLLRRTAAPGEFVDTDNNSADFELSALPKPPPAPPPPPPNPPSRPALSPSPVPPRTAVKSATTAVPPGAAALVVTEIVPNPAAPQTDAEGEFVEIYNPGIAAVSLVGFRLQTGTTFGNSVALKDYVVPAGGYVAITSADTSLTLSNSAGAVRLLDPSGAVVVQSDAYETAKDGLAWALIDGSWQWTSSPTPGAANVLTVTAGGSGEQNGSQPSSARTRAASTPAGTGTAVQRAAGSDSAQSRSLHPFILAGIGMLAVGYAIYEYRDDIALKFHKLRRYRESRRSYRQPAKRR